MKEPNVHDELKDIAPGLSQMKSSEGYSVPPVYFKELQDKVMGQIHAEQQKAPAGSWLIDLLAQYFKPRYAFAMATVTIVVVAALVFRNGGNDNAILASITAEDAYEYVYGHISEYETLDLYTLADNENADYILDVFSDDELDFAIDALIDDIGTESLEELF
ncbi:MAG: hypothetical protein DRI69_02005 [Bacteroidetes bacterium]|nr:MAG: hypothetical protein DRI69_02005 [Bacteroidota bacterium]